MKNRLDNIIGILICYLAMLIFWAVLLGCSGAVHVENDIGALGQKNIDRYYTHGTKFSYFKETEKEKETYSIGQNIYTPSTKKPNADPAILKRDRPYTGWLYAEYRDAKIKSEYIKDIFGIQIGCTGACSFARQTQQQVHRWLNQSVPSWDRNYTLKSEPGIILEAERYYKLQENNYNDFVIYGTGKAGNIIDNAALGADFRLGFNLDKFASEPIIVKLPNEKPSSYILYFFARTEERFVPYNHFLDGSLFQSERHTVNSEKLVQEGDLGFTVGYKNYKFTYRYTLFSNEWKEKNGSFAFGGLDFAW